MASSISPATIGTLLDHAAIEKATGEQGAVTSMIQFLQNELADQPADLAIVESALREQSPAASSRLADLLNRHARNDRGFEAEFQARWAHIQAAANERTGVANSVIGDVSGPVVQARDVFGGISFRDSAQ
ncbi:hypothetical protein BJ973_001129 [Actinoplanes tereljensis]|uniref:Uncharacterized protein n=1 Tax=Paractinoplanes tereljensis TaxID=571912 RepID=A0A919P0I9_9ACTN|nr:hypothetical protein [Actinoplanes tereljensis]GIF26682.1 hypothetical protein Ate02nite_94120 [Actinoplanes tereljensis]